MIAPLSWRTPPRHYGPWELVTSMLTEGLVERGHDVTLFATADSITSAELSAVCPRPYSEDPTIDVKVWESLHLANVFERADEFDVIHNHYDFLPLTYGALHNTPLVTTIHGFSSERVMPVYQRYDGRTAYVAVSDAHRDPRLTYVGTVHHGIPVEDYPFRSDVEDHLVFWGRVDHDKGAAEAIDVARRAGRRLLIGGIVPDREYFDRAVAPHVDGDRVVYLGPVGSAERATVLGRAVGLLHMVNFDEPFGLSLIEAMAHGTPVVSMRRGAADEVIAHGTSGFLVDNLDEAVDAVHAVPRLDRAAVHQHVKRHFSRDRMTEDYLTIYRALLARQRV